MFSNLWLLSECMFDLSIYTFLLLCMIGAVLLCCCWSVCMYIICFHAITWEPLHHLDLNSVGICLVHRWPLLILKLGVTLKVKVTEITCLKSAPYPILPHNFKTSASIQEMYLEVHEVQLFTEISFIFGFIMFLSYNYQYLLLTGGNVMLQNTELDQLVLRIIDFGLSQPLDTELGLNLRGFRSDVCEVLRIFSGLYTSQEFDNVWDIQKNYKDKLKEVNSLPGIYVYI